MLAIVSGILLIVFMNPPYTVCDSQMASFKEAQKGFIYLDSKDKIKKTTDFQLLNRQCKTTNSPGGCYELFRRLKNMLKDLEGVSEECTDQIGGDSQLRKIFWETFDLMVRLAWGQKPPASYNEKLGWFEPPDLLLYCRMKRSAERIYGKSRWEQFREKMFKELPGITTLDRSRAWEVMLLSINCNSYL